MVVCLSAGVVLLAELSGTGRLIPGGELTQAILTSGFALAVFPLAVGSRLPQASSEAEVPFS